MLQRRYRCRVEPVVAGLPRGARGYQVLYAVMHKELPNQLALAGYLGIDRTVLPYVIDDMVEAGLVERQAAPGDRRARRVVATATGRATFARVEAQVRAAEATLLGELDDTESAWFRSLLSRLARRAREDDAALAVNESDL